MEKRILLAGIGRGGCRLVDSAGMLAGSGISIAAVSSDASVISMSSAPVKVLIGGEKLKGEGCGGDESLGRQAAEEDIGVLRGLFEGYSHAFIVACLGGGTGTGAIVPHIRAARDAGSSVFCFAILPFEFEGERRARKAERALEEIASDADAVIAVSNESMASLAGDIPLDQVFGKVNEILGAGLGAFCRSVSDDGYLALNRGELRRMTGTCERRMGFAYGGEGAGQDMARQCVGMLLDNPMPGSGAAISEADDLLVGITGDSCLGIGQVGIVMDAIRSAVRPGTVIRVGVLLTDAIEDRMIITVLSGRRRGSIATDSVIEPDAAKQSGRPKNPDVRQISLNFEPVAKGRFKDVEPTLYDGQDMDVPTFRRRGINI